MGCLLNLRIPCCALALIAVGSLWFASSHAADNDAQSWYRIEMTLLAYDDARIIDRERWPIAIDSPASPLDDVADVGARIAQPFHINTPLYDSIDQHWWAPLSVTTSADDFWQRLGLQSAPQQGDDNTQILMQPVNNHSIDESAFERREKQLNRLKYSRVVWQHAWTEPVQAKASAFIHPLNINSVQRQNGIHISGSVTVYLSRYLHAQTDLVVQYSKPSALAQLSDSAYSATAPSPSLFVPNQTPAMHNTSTLTRAARVMLSRRMRSNELHYLDHPMLGLVVRIIPAQSPVPSDDEHASLPTG